MYTYEKIRSVEWMFFNNAAIHMKNVSVVSPSGDGIIFKMIDGTQVKVDAISFQTFQNQMNGK